MRADLLFKETEREGTKQDTHLAAVVPGIPSLDPAA